MRYINTWEKCKRGGISPIAEDWYCDECEQYYEEE